MMTFRDFDLRFKISYRIVRDLRRMGLFRVNKPHYKMLWEDMEHPIELRYDSSDRHAFKQIFMDEEYAPVKDISQVKLIVDCGAYAGISGRYLLRQFPQATLVCVEPNADNFALCEKNLSYYAPRVI
ncbi:MAG: hypothetical protein K8I00_08745, partial [Candidatus Omnitrophica bacterium]|nr:hypothetical protein [Candidatus Omnitrophota bacterium]